MLNFKSATAILVADPFSSIQVVGVLSLVDVGSSGFTQSLMLTFQRTEPCANTTGLARWLGQGEQSKMKDAENEVQGGKAESK